MSKSELGSKVLDGEPAKEIPKFDKILEKIYTVFVVAVSIILTLVVTYQILSRPMGLLNIWTEEITRWIFVWMCFLGAAYYFKKQEHISVDVLAELKSIKKFEKPLNFILRLLALVFLLAITYGGIIYSLEYGNRVSPGLRIPERFLYISAAVCFGLMSMFEIWNLCSIVFKLFRKGKNQ